MGDCVFISLVHKKNAFFVKVEKAKQRFRNWCCLKHTREKF